ncbi:MAG: FKBP-type peptidyl-prolyl cis-trans isomerase [Bacteroidales bacterium]|nr:FKBP-type peptidyl-prolyl cis-trans isomerase [Bacteroidales bacterium]MBN2819464.1 FKBP-type peptidyl-prolyl cis-trans isomerase [Bacteroidales bacterium]
MTISNETVVSLIYDLRVDSLEGEIIESLTEEKPLTFLFGAGNLLPKFEENIDGLGIGDAFEFNLNSSEAYGDVNHDAIVDVPLAAFQVNGSVDDNLLKIGNTIPMRDNQGNKLNGVVKDITDSTVVMDFNHPLAGNHLFFTGKVTDVRQATEEELSHGHLHSSCGCGGGGCGDGHHGEDGCGDSCGDGGCGDGSCGC